MVSAYLTHFTPLYFSLLLSHAALCIIDSLLNWFNLGLGKHVMLHRHHPRQQQHHAQLLSWAPAAPWISQLDAAHRPPSWLRRIHTPPVLGMKPPHCQAVVDFLLRVSAPPPPTTASERERECPKLSAHKIFVNVWAAADDEKEKN